jgi:kynurenine formamidase
LDRERKESMMIANEPQQKTVRWIDLTAEITEDARSYPGTSSGMVMERVDCGIPSATLTRFRHLDPHCGTHLDAPLHFIPGARDVAELPLQMPEIVIVASHDSPIPPAVLAETSGLSGKAVLFSTGWEKNVGTPAFFEGYPALSRELATALATLGVGLVGVDTPSVDPPAGQYPAHRVLLGAGIPILEGLIGLRALSTLLADGGNAYLAAFPLRIRGLEGSPVRAVAVLDPPP